jgi:hypothetical protein
MIAPVVYLLGTLVTLSCGVLLLRGYFRGKNRLLLWSGLCFLSLAASNLMLFVDLVLLPNIDLYRWRLCLAAVAMLLLLYGLIWEGD